MSKKNSPSSDATIQKIRQSKSANVKLAVTDIDGILRGKYIHKDKFESAAAGGFGFCNVVFGWDMNDVCYDNTRYTGWHTGYPDAQACIDLSTLRYVPWEEGTPFLLADFVDAEGAPLGVCPRQMLKRAVSMATEMGYETYVGLEFEWFNFRETPETLAQKHYLNPHPITPGMFGYSILRSSLNQPYFSDIVRMLEEFRVPVEGIHTETGPGVYEIALQGASALEAADRGVLLKTAVKEIAYRHGIVPSFMAKWNSKLPGCGGHIHQSLVEKGKNVFYDKADPRKMSSIFKSYLAGQMQLMPELLPMLVPNINSYKRLVEGLWAPTRVTWGSENRTAAFRVIPGSEKSTRLETRVGGADMNPYLAVAASLASGLYGVKHGLKLKDEPVSGSAYEKKEAVKFPNTLRDATQKFRESAVARELFGDMFVDHYSETREWEVRQHQAAVTSWELERYFELV